MYTSLCDRTDLIGLIFYYFVSAAEQRKGKLFFLPILRCIPTGQLAECVGSTSWLEQKVPSSSVKIFHSVLAHCIW